MTTILRRAHRTRRAFAVVATLGIAAGGLTLAAPTASALPQIKSFSGATYVSFDDIAPAHFDAIDDLAERVNRIAPGEEDVVFAVEKKGPRSAVGVFDPNRPAPSLMVECDPAVDTWESYLRGSCSGNEDSLSHMPRN